jgi:hypothetical protein
MGKVILDAELKAKLNGLHQELEFCDEEGKTLGHFVPAKAYRELLYTWAKAQFTDEEIEQARREVRAEGGYTTAEVIAHIEKIVREAKGST